MKIMNCIFFKSLELQFTRILTNFWLNFDRKLVSSWNINNKLDICWSNNCYGIKVIKSDEKVTDHSDLTGKLSKCVQYKINYI